MSEGEKNGKDGEATKPRTIIPAAPGWYLVTLVHNDSDGELGFEGIIAW